MPVNTANFGRLPSRKQPFLLFDAQVSIDAFQHNAGGDLGEFFGLDFVEASAVDAAFRNQFFAPGQRIAAAF